MNVIDASDVKSQLDALLDAVEKDRATSVLIRRGGRPAAMLLNAQVAEAVILGAYSTGVLPRSVAMQQLGMDWYGDLLLRLNAHGIKRPTVSTAEVARMNKAVEEVLGATTLAAKARNRKSGRST
jgi:hypothetical protein